MPDEPSPYWPPSGLVLTIGELILRPVAEADLDELADLLPADLEMNPHTPRPFDLPEPQARGVALRQERWKTMGSWNPDSWDLGFLVRYGDRPIGMQSLEAEDFAVLRTVETASWLAVEFRGRGFGKLARTAVLALAFDGLGAEVALTEAWTDNAASLGVSRSIGYLPNGSVRHRRGDAASEMPRLRLDRSQWRSVPRPQVAIAGLDSCLAWFGAASGHR